MTAHTEVSLFPSMLCALPSRGARCSAPGSCNPPAVSAARAAREHVVWAVLQGMTPGAVCESVNAFLTAPTWTDAERVLELRWTQMQEGRDMPIITDRQAGYVA